MSHMAHDIAFKKISQKRQHLIVLTSSVELLRVPSTTSLSSSNLLHEKVT